MKSDSQQPSLERDQLVAKLRNAGLRATASRVAVLDRLFRAKRPISHAEVVGELKAFTWDRSTLYRNLNDLAEAGLARRSEVGDHTWRFEVISQEDGHPDHIAHFHCRSCGFIACLHDITVAPAKDVGGLPLALLRGDIEIQVLGKCDRCLIGV